MPRRVVVICRSQSRREHSPSPGGPHEPPRGRKRHRDGVPEGRGGVARDRLGEAELHARAVPGQLPARSPLPVPHPAARPARVRRLLPGVQDLPPRRGRLDRHRHHGRVPAARGPGPHQARRLRHEDPQGLRWPGLHQPRVPARDGAGGLGGRQPLGPALRAPVDRRAAAAQALRQRHAAQEVPAALRRRRDLRLRTDRGQRRLRPGAAHHPLRADARGRLPAQRREALVHQRHARQAAGGDGGRPGERARSAPSWSRPPGPA